MSMRKGGFPRTDPRGALKLDEGIPEIRKKILSPRYVTTKPLNIAIGK